MSDRAEAIAREIETVAVLVAPLGRASGEARWNAAQLIREQASALRASEERAEKAEAQALRLYSGEEVQSVIREHNAAEARVKELETALRPFAKVADVIRPFRSDREPLLGYDGIDLTAGDFRAARSALGDSHE